MDDFGEQGLETDPAVNDFWNLARFHARLNDIPSYFGSTPLEAVQPPAWAFDGTSEEASRMLEQLLAQRQITNDMLLSDFTEAGASLPEIGTLGIVLDGAGHPRALVATTAVEVDGGQVIERLKVLYASES